MISCNKLFNVLFICPLPPWPAFLADKKLFAWREEGRAPSHPLRSNPSPPFFADLWALLRSPAMTILVPFSDSGVLFPFALPCNLSCAIWHLPFLFCSSFSSHPPLTGRKAVHAIATEKVTIGGEGGLGSRGRKSIEVNRKSCQEGGEGVKASNGEGEVSLTSGFLSELAKAERGRGIFRTCRLCGELLKRLRVSSLTKKVWKFSPQKVSW